MGITTAIFKDNSTPQSPSPLELHAYYICLYHPHDRVSAYTYRGKTVISPQHSVVIISTKSKRGTPLRFSYSNFQAFGQICPIASWQIEKQLIQFSLDLQGTSHMWKVVGLSESMSPYAILKREGWEGRHRLKGDTGWRIGERGQKEGMEEKVKKRRKKMKVINLIDGR